MNHLTRNYIITIAFAVMIKLTLIANYRSTDFEVHRNWLAITYHLPMREWYFEATSIWTLDYPPLFAYFEWFLAQIAALIDKDKTILVISEKPQINDTIIFFQRGSVIVSDIVLFYATSRYLEGWNIAVSDDIDINTRKSEDKSNKRIKETTFQLLQLPITSENKVVIYALIVLNAGLLLVDHIHFQYNGFLIGFLILSIDFIQRKSYLKAAVTFSVVVLMKHLFVTLVPIYAIYLSRMPSSA